MRKFRTLDEFEEEYFRKRPEEIDNYLTEIFQEYSEDNDSGALLASLRVVARVRGINDIADQIGMTYRGLQKALSSNGNPRLENVNSIMKALGYFLTPTTITDNFCDSKLDIPQTAEVPTNDDD
ncbi:addiction module antidote protein [Nostoc sp. ChiQUE01b]|uniref:addiction module antidote protein n=1 Tax=Nostoc sp. ChiQUE01b TaxID=3075376 RepID=UPI002AD3142E|nr:addiction module antidote protein [Nostoc sp. ChiQUE01b]MDZ8261362.1 putative addiction module antidote protein [Nostoc sp. ChiQUE01b]